MKKGLLVLGVAAIAAFAFVGCQQETMEAKVKDLPTGSENHDFEGETLTFSEPTAYIVKTVSVSGTNPTTTITRTAYKTTTYTITFGEDGVFSYAEQERYAAGADNTAALTDSTTTTTTTTYTYSDGGSASGHLWTNFADKVISTTTYTGSWESAKVKDSEDDARTLNYIITYASKNDVSNTDNGTAGTVTYNLSSTSTTTTAYTAGITEPAFAYAEIAEDSDDNKRFYIFDDTTAGSRFIQSGNYTLQDN